METATKTTILSLDVKHGVTIGGIEELKDDDDEEWRCGEKIRSWMTYSNSQRPVKRWEGG